MRSRSPRWLFLCASGLALFILLVERRGGTGADRFLRAHLAFPIQPDQVREITLQQDALRMEIALDPDGAWMIRTPKASRANDAAVLRLLQGLETLPVFARIPVAEMESNGTQLADYGLERPAAELRVVQGGLAQTLEIGGLSPDRNGLYVRVADQPDVIRTQTNLLAWISSNANDWRDRRVFQAALADVERLELRRPGGYLKTSRGDSGEWTLRQPFTARADRVFTESFIEKALQLRVEEFVTDNGGAEPGYGFEESGRELVFEGARLPGGSRRLLLGKSPSDHPDRVFAMFRGDPSVFLVSTQSLIWAETPVTNFRSRRLTAMPADAVTSVDIHWGDRKLQFQKDSGSWNMISPMAMPAEPDRVAMLIEAWTSAKIQGFVDPPATRDWEEGWADPAGELVFHTGNTADVVRIVAQRKSPEAGRILIRVNEEPSLYLVSTDLADTLTLDPILFRNLTVLQLEAGTLRRIRRQQGDQDLTADRQPDGSWTATNGAVNAESTKALLSALRNLRALSWVRYAPSNLAAFGLEDPYVSLTLYQSGAEGFVLTLILGRESGLGRYAMIRGRDTVFLLDSDVSKILCAPFIPSAPAPSAPAPE